MKNQNLRKSEKLNTKYLIGLLATRNLTLASCESLTGGLFAKSLTDIAGVGQIFKGGFIAYNNEVKVKLVKISPSTLEKYGAISEQCAKEMARNTQRLLTADLAISFTGNAGPRAQENKPVGMVFVGLALKERLISNSYQFFGSRREIREKAVEEGVKLIINELIKVMQYNQIKMNNMKSDKGISFTVNYVRQSWLDIFQQKGVATLKKYFNNPNLAPGRNLVNCQRVIRTDDLVNINSQSYHQTLFEMLGIFSVGGNLPKNIEDLDNKRFIEVCNIVFPEFYHKEKDYLPLAERCVDTGAGLERIAMVLQGKKNTFEIDL
nr:11749_t:CDS:2 [Entrophospora candida]